jgi:adenylate cyclase
MAYFEADGDQTASKRALSCALTMMAANQNLIRPVLVNAGVEPIRFRVSIDTGYITVARIGAARRFNANVAIGATANFTAKMLARAAPDEIVLGDVAFKELPILWQIQHAELLSASTGWVHTSTGLPYLLHRYIGRWKQ